MTRLRADTTLRAAVVDSLGQDIVSGALAEGQVLSAEGVCQRFGVSRSIARESLRELDSLGMVRARPKVGTTVQPHTTWNRFHERIIAWRGRYEMSTQVREMLETRIGTEPVAAGLAAERITDDEVAALEGALLGMQQANADQDANAYIRHDTEFHRIVYDASRNAMLSQFALVFAEILQTRLGGSSPINERTQESLSHHAALCLAVAGRRREAAERAAAKIVSATLAEFEKE